MSISEDLQHEQELAERNEAISDLRGALRRNQKALLRATTKIDDLVEASKEGAYDAMLALGPYQPIIVPEKDKRKHNGEVALWDLGDWQGSKVTSTYNSLVMRERVMRYCEKALKITQIQRADHPVKKVQIVFGGDMVEGLFNYPTQPFEIDSTLFEQYVLVSRLLVDVVRYALGAYDEVVVTAEWGNHGRIGSKRSAVPRNDNVDRMCYELARQLLAGEKRLTWEDCPEDVQRLEIGNYRALVIHGDEIGRMGFAAPGTIVQHMNKWRSGSFRIEGEPWEFRDVYIHHYHTHNSWAMANGEGSVYQNGSTESDNRYAGVHMASSAIPSQRLHFIDPVRGRVTAEYKVWLDS